MEFLDESNLPAAFQGEQTQESQLMPSPGHQPYEPLFTQMEPGENTFPIPNIYQQPAHNNGPTVPATAGHPTAARVVPAAPSTPLNVRSAPLHMGEVATVPASSNPATPHGGGTGVGPRMSASREDTEATGKLVHLDYLFFVRSATTLLTQAQVARRAPAAPRREWEKIVPSQDQLPVWRCDLTRYTMVEFQDLVIRKLGETRNHLAGLLHSENSLGAIRWQLIIAGSRVYGPKKLVFMTNEMGFRDFADAVADSGNAKVTVRLTMEDPQARARQQEAERLPLERLRARQAMNPRADVNGNPTAPFVAQLTAHILATYGGGTESLWIGHPTDPLLGMQIHTQRLWAWARCIMHGLNPAVDMDHPPETDAFVWINRPTPTLAARAAARQAAADLASGPNVARHTGGDNNPVPPTNTPTRPADRPSAEAASSIRPQRPTNDVRALTEAPRTPIDGQMTARRQATPQPASLSALAHGGNTAAIGVNPSSASVPRPVATWKGSRGMIRPKRVGVSEVARVPVPSLTQSDIEVSAPAAGSNEAPNLPQSTTAPEEVISISSPGSEVQIIGPPGGKTINGPHAGVDRQSARMFPYSSDVQGRKYPRSPDGSMVARSYLKAPLAGGNP
ncbi:uncharacterized protein PGTG_10236 [Puccinia graminis f. sp. tritici CRL 75-36-700-3]|uniref:Uncharacterized protein n=1 Tax=Puccinia graminis f. sp. tritici (strain CRL 75-36-700-3 / race SCCL) TaxID=418459 RepID=E3KJP1_PUCGT|nr:uncharacterized protein PGTG_10236 [Puccinia graminis f. sp. tritici CRL 75-36-700-3]EFP84516.2 hypothetical protein PGTG_10236 [Puccinia graminis f. sp. tritici CRL 75-36-700-3]